jgi:hypothetical protein
VLNVVLSNLGEEKPDEEYLKEIGLLDESGNVKDTSNVKSDIIPMVKIENQPSVEDSDDESDNDEDSDEEDKKESDGEESEEEENLTKSQIILKLKNKLKNIKQLTYAYIKEACIELDLSIDDIKPEIKRYKDGNRFYFKVISI